MVRRPLGPRTAFRPSVTVKISKSGKLVGTAARRVLTSARRITYTTGPLTTGTYKVQFVVNGTVTKVTTVTVR